MDLDIIDMEEDRLKLVYVKFLGKNTDGTFVYNFFFSETPEYTWGPFWDVDNPSSNGDLTPDPTTYSLVKTVTTTLPLKTAEETTCYSMEYATYGILALSWVNIELMDEYPPSRCVLHFGDTLEYVKDTLSIINANFK